MQAPKIETVPNGLTTLERIAAREKNAVEDFIRLYSGLVWKIARKHTNNIEDAEDAVQEIFLNIWMNAHRFDAEKSPESAFICLLAQRKAIDLFRKRRNQILEVAVESVDSSKELKNRDYRNVILNLDLKAVRLALSNLSAIENEFIRLSIFAGSSHTEIAEQFGLPLGTVKSKIRRGINKIRTSVGKPFLADLHKAYYG